MEYFDRVGAGMVVGGFFSVIGVITALWVLIVSRNKEMSDNEVDENVTPESPLLINKKVISSYITVCNQQKTVVSECELNM
jgi:hypothetical protein